MVIGQNIKRVRLSLGLSMDKFGSLIDSKAKSGTVANWEIGRNSPNAKRLKRIAELGNITVEELTLPTHYLHHVPLADLKAEITRREQFMEELK